MHLAPIIQDLAVILVIASLASVAFRRLRQPIVLGYLVAGAVLGPHTPPFSWVTDLPGIRLWAELGVIFLMFSLGLEFNFERLRGLGTTPLVTGFFEALFMFAVGTIAGHIVGWYITDSIFLGAILSVSSTTIIARAIEELGLKKQRFAELVFGSLIVDDMVGILILAILTTWCLAGEISLGTFLWAISKLIGIVIIWILTGHFVLIRFVNWIGKHKDGDELTLVSVGLCLALVVISSHFRFSGALGAFVMGSILAGSIHAKRIEQLVQPLKEVFGAVFFVATGMLLNPEEVTGNWGIIALATILTVVGKVVSVAIGARISGQKPITSLQMGLAMAQIGEFSFIFAGMGLTLEVMRPALYPIAITVSVLTTLTTPYLIRISQSAFLIRVLR